MCHSIKNICVQSIGFLVFSHFISAQTPPSTWSGFSGPSHAGPAAVVAEAEKNKFTIPTSTKKYTLQNYLAPRATFNESCYYFAHYCLRAYMTGMWSHFALHVLHIQKLLSIRLCQLHGQIRSMADRLYGKMF
ncbi:uncharacterized protein LOC116774942 isoform X2 [Danaus plexippus]|uniref:uncharacterized protein LOC116774942 isoform X2 n=1 Tax=Danaus plexippus TaxID=13037 RepID=UPI0013C49110|nr:uncharacterized protein LOC116774942 isoform X2 [Danaus plexippus]